MKYLAQHAKIATLLRGWAGDRELIVAHYYFWNAGTHMQKSQNGLLQTLLFHIMQQSPETARDLVPARFWTSEDLDISPWTTRELCTAIKAFGQEKQLGARLCFFIDGLDEYVGEHEDLVELLAALAKSPYIKLCVSSRPWNVFSRAYNKRTDGQLSLHELTKHDITKYIKNKLEASPLFRDLELQNPRGCRQLTRDITTKAQGVFLWVYLVVRSLLRGLRNDDSLIILQRRLFGFPETLDGYFQRMFDRIESVYRTHSARILLAAFHSEKPLPLWAPRYLELELESLGRDVNIEAADCQCHGKGDLHYTPEQQEQVRRYIDARCADLLEVVSDGVVFIHRTARDFLDHRSWLGKLRVLAGPEFRVTLSLAKLYLTDSKTASTAGYNSAGLRHVDYTAEASRLLVLKHDPVLFECGAFGSSLDQAPTETFSGASEHIWQPLIPQEIDDIQTLFSTPAAKGVKAEYTE